MADPTPTPPPGLTGLALPETKPAPAPAPEAQKTETPRVEAPAAPTPPPQVVTPEDYKRMTAEVDSTGDLSEESYKNLEAKGLPRDVVKSYVDGQKSVVASQIAQLHSEVGGKDQFAAIQKWAGEKLSEEQKLAFNRTLASRDMGAITLALRGLKAQYAAEYGTDPKLTTGSPTSAGSAPFTSTREYIDAKKSPLFQKSEAYRQEVERRFLASTFWKQ